MSKKSKLVGIFQAKEKSFEKSFCLLAPPHAHDILALHRHGHKFGGLPIIFWIALVVLIIIFHLFLLKIVLNEMGFFKHTLPTYSRPRAL